MPCTPLSIPSWILVYLSYDLTQTAYSSQFLPGYLKHVCLGWRPFYVQYSLNSFLDTWEKSEREILFNNINSQFLPGYLRRKRPRRGRRGGRLSIPSWILALFPARVFPLSYWALNSFLDTCEGLYRCYIRFGGIYVYPPLELKDLVLGKNVDQRT